MKKTISTLLIVGLALLCFAGVALAKQTPAQLKGQTLYLPLVSHVYLGAKNKRYELTVTFTFRNRDSNKAITLASIEYINDEGRSLGNLLESPRVLQPLASFQMPVASPQKKGGKDKGAPCLIVKWNANQPVTPPLVQCIMIGATGQQGISFSTTASPLP